ncbi:MAG: hypothetical protein D6753_09860, partial [Planctomycetota bacterium]
PRSREEPVPEPDTSEPKSTEVTRPKDDLEPTYSSAEGIHSDAEELQQQADRSWEPDEGTNLLADKDSKQNEEAPIQ